MENEFHVEKQNELNRLVLESICIVHSLLEDYCKIVGDLTKTESEIIKSRVLDTANENLKKIKEKYA